MYCDVCGELKADTYCAVIENNPELERDISNVVVCKSCVSKIFKKLGQKGAVGGALSVSYPLQFNIAKESAVSHKWNDERWW